MRFTIRELLLVTVIVGMALGWWIERRQNAVLVAEKADVLKDAKAMAEFLDGLRGNDPGLSPWEFEWKRKYLPGYISPSQLR